MSGFKHEMTLDELLGIAILWLAKAVLILFCLSALLLTAFMLPDLIFPNDAGWNDLDNMEILFYSCWALLTARYVGKVKKHKARVSRAIYRYVIAFGIHGMMFATLLTGLIAVPGDGELWFDLYSDVIDVVAELSWLALLFAITPKGKLPASEEKANAKNAEMSKPRQKEASNATEQAPNV